MRGMVETAAEEREEKLASVSKVIIAQEFSSSVLPSQHRFRNEKLEEKTREIQAEFDALLG